MRHMVVLFFALLSTPVWALNSAVQSQGLEDITLTIDFDENDHALATVQTPRGTFKNFTNIDHIPTNAEGTPNIPYVHRWFVVENNKVYKVTYKIDGVQVKEGVRLLPIQPDVIDDGRPRPFAFSRIAYLRNHWFGSDVVTVGEKKRLGALTMLPITIAAAQFNPRMQALKTFRSIEINVKVVGEDERAPGTPIEQVTDFQISQAEVLAVNGTDAPRPRDGDKSIYLVITSEDLLPQAHAIADYHASEGREVVYKTVTAATTSTQIRDLIKAQYDASRLEAVLIFGDEKRVKLHNWSNEIPGDAFYSFVSGNDYIADISLGRLPVSDAAEADLMVQKHNYYRTTQNNGYSNKNIMMVAHKENYPGKYTGNLEQVRNGANPKELNFVTQYGGQGATNASVLEKASSGQYAIINYRGHGSYSAWAGWGRDGGSFGLNQAGALQNANEGMSVFFNIACYNGGIHQSSDSLSERMLFHNDGLNPNRGAIAALGATLPSLTDVNHKYNVNLFKAIQDSENLTLGNINALAANKLVRDAGGSISKNVKMYILFADPLLRPWL